MAVEIRPAQPIRRLAAPSSASTNDSALSNASLETAITSSLGNELPGDGLSAAMLPPERSYMAWLTGRGVGCGGIDAGLSKRWQGHRIRDFGIIGAVRNSAVSQVARRMGPCFRREDGGAVSPRWRFPISTIERAPIFHLRRNARPA